MNLVKKIILFFTLSNFLFSCSIYNKKVLEPYYKGPASDHFDGRKFSSTIQGIGFLDLASFLISPKGDWENSQPEALLTFFQNKSPINKARITFIGHSTFLIQLPHINILTDPIWSQRAGPFEYFNPARHSDPAIAFEDLPKIDAVLLSNNSYYHIDIPTIKLLRDKFNPQFITGLGNCYYLNVKEKLKIACVELDWNKKVSLEGNADIYFAKAKYWSKRGFFDYNKTLWGSFIINDRNIKIFFAGDTGYSNHLKEIGYRYGPFDVALLPIGNYEPKEVMGIGHLNPKQAIKAHLDLGSNKSIAMHFGTFRTSAEDYFDPLITLEESKNLYGIGKDNFVAPKFGEVFDF